MNLNKISQDDYIFANFLAHPSHSTFRSKPLQSPRNISTASSIHHKRQWSSEVERIIFSFDSHTTRVHRQLRAACCSTRRSQGTAILSSTHRAPLLKSSKHSFLNYLK